MIFLLLGGPCDSHDITAIANHKASNHQWTKSSPALNLAISLVTLGEKKKTSLLKCRFMLTLTPLKAHVMQTMLIPLTRFQVHLNLPFRKYVPPVISPNKKSGWRYTIWVYLNACVLLLNVRLQKITSRRHRQS